MWAQVGCWTWSWTVFDELLKPNNRSTLSNLATYYTTAIWCIWCTIKTGFLWRKNKIKIIFRQSVFLLSTCTLPVNMQCSTVPQTHGYTGLLLLSPFSSAFPSSGAASSSSTQSTRSSGGWVSRSSPCACWLCTPNSCVAATSPDESESSEWLHTLMMSLWSQPEAAAALSCDISLEMMTSDDEVEPSEWTASGTEAFVSDSS